MDYWVAKTQKVLEALNDGAGESGTRGTGESENPRVGESGKGDI